MENPLELIRVGREMRAAQKLYFDSRSKAHLSVAKDWERKFDALLAVLNPPAAANEQPRQGTLFD